METLRAEHSRELAAAGRDKDRGTGPQPGRRLVCMSFCAFLKAVDRTTDTGCGFLIGILDGRSRASDLELTIGKLQSERERDRDALADAEKRSRALEAKISKLNDDVTRLRDFAVMINHKKRHVGL